MKTFKNYKIVAFFLAMTMVLSCVKDDDYDVPNTDPVAPIIDGEIISINALNSLLEQEQTTNSNDILSFTESNLYISGYVISNDEAGNIYEELVLGKNLKKTAYKNILYADEKQKITKSFEKTFLDLKKSYLKNDIKKIITCLKNNV